MKPPPPPPGISSIQEFADTFYLQVVKTRYLSLVQSMPPQPQPIDADEDEYEPVDYEPEDEEQLANRADALGDLSAPAPTAFELPKPPQLTIQEYQQHGELAVRRTFGLLDELDEKGRSTKSGFNRLAGNDFGRDAWITIAARLASRAGADLNDTEDGIKDEYAVKSVKGSLSLSDSIRDLMHDYILRDWKKRIDVAVSWLNEEWYNDFVVARSDNPAKATSNGAALPNKGNYHTHALRLLDSLLPYVAPTDKGLIRLYSELPAVDYELLAKVKTMAQDPERVSLATQVLQYLHMFRPPVKAVVEEVTAELWRENERARPKAGALLKVWRPELLVDGSGEVKMEGSNGITDTPAV